MPTPGRAIVTAAIGNPRPRTPRGGGGLGGLKPPIKVPTIPGSFGRPRPPKKSASATALVKYLKA